MFSIQTTNRLDARSDLWAARLEPAPPNLEGEHPPRHAVLAVVAVVVPVVVFVVPMAIVHLPAAIIPIIVWVRPVGSGVGWSLPDAGTPGVTSTLVAPVTIGPNIAFSGHGGADFTAQGRWGSADVNVDLCVRGSG